MPTYIRRMLYEAAIKLVGKEALMGEDKAQDKENKDREARIRLFRDVLEDMLEAMEETRQRIVEVRLPSITVSEDLFKGDVREMIGKVAKALSEWFYAATEEARRKGKPCSEDPNDPGYVLLIAFASLVLVNGLRQLALIGG
jgi:predicted Holliday junction resolvase-like endonuclease